MAVRLDDNVKERGIVFLDFSKMKFSTEEDMRNALWKIPDLRLRHDRLWDEEVLCKYNKAKLNYPFPNPVPASLSSVRIRDLSQVDIDWRMMTLLRPNTKVEEEIFTRLIQLDKLKRQTAQEEVVNPSRAGVSRSSLPRIISYQSRSLPQPSPRNKRQQLQSDDEDDEAESVIDQFSYQFFERFEDLDIEDKITDEPAHSFGEASHRKKAKKNHEQKEKKKASRRDRNSSKHGKKKTRDRKQEKTAEAEAHEENKKQNIKD